VVGRLTSFVLFFFTFFSGSYLVSSSSSEVWLVLRFWRSALCFTSHSVLSSGFSPALQLGFLCIGLLGACSFALPPFSRERSEISQLAPCCQCVMLFADCFSILELFDFVSCSLAQEIGFVDHYLPYFRQWLVICPLST
jgi:hypothetical protein